MALFLAEPFLVQGRQGRRESEQPAVCFGVEELAGPGEGIIHKVEIPLTGLAPGDYLLEMKARHTAEEVVVTRQVLIEVF